MTNVNGLIVGNVYRWLSTKAPGASCLTAALKQENKPVGIVLTLGGSVSPPPSCAEARKHWENGVAPNDIFSSRQTYLPGFNSNVSGLSTTAADSMFRAVAQNAFLAYLPSFVVEEVAEIPCRKGPKLVMIRAHSTTTAETFYLVPFDRAESNFFEEAK